MLLTVAIRADRPLSGTFSSFSESKCQGLLFHTISTSSKSFILPYLILIGAVSASLLAPPAIIWRSPCERHCSRQSSAMPQPQPALRFFDMHSHRSITSYITFWLGLEARFQLTGACDRALTVLTHIFPSSRDAYPSPPAARLPLPPLAQTPLCPFTPFGKAVI